MIAVGVPVLDQPNLAVAVNAADTPCAMLVPAATVDTDAPIDTETVPAADTAADCHTRYQALSEP